MPAIGLACYLLWCAWGWYGALLCYRLYSRGADHFFLQPLGVAVYLLVGLASCAGYRMADGARSTGPGPGNPIGEMPVFFLGVSGYCLYFAAVVVEAGRRFFSPEASIVEVRSSSQGDAAMVRRDFARAVALYRRDLARWPGDLELLRKLADALTAAGQAEQAAMELALVRLDLLRGPRHAPAEAGTGGLGAPGAALRDRQERILVVTLALGDLYAGPLQNPHRARKLYEETLEELYGAPGSDTLRARLRQLERGAVPGTPVAPESVSLDEEP